MSGFFKKLFNRITGKKDEAPAPAAVPEVEALPLPEPAPEPPAPLPEPDAEPAPEKQPDIAPTVSEPELLPSPVLVEETLQPAPELPSAGPGPAHRPAVAKRKDKPAKVPAAVPMMKPAAKPKPAAKLAAPRAAPKPAPPKPEPPKPVPEPAKPPPRARTKAKPAPAPAPEPVAAPATEPPRAPAPEVRSAPPQDVPAPAPVAPPPLPPPPPDAAVAAEDARQRRSWFSRLKDGLSKSSRSITGSITSIFTKRKLDRETLQDLEDVLLQADLGLPMAERIVRAVADGRYDREIDPEDVKRILAAEVAKVLKPVEVPFNFGSEKPFIILVVGVNGAGKTTTIGKLGAIASREGFRVMFAACDTFRAAAIEQLTVWGQRIGAKTLSRPTGADASGLAFDAIREAKADGTDIVFIDTAGRLQNKAYLMDELDKIVRVIKKQDETAPHAVLLVLDATTGQNAMAQAEIFTKVAGVTGLIMTKLDGTARGGILVAIAERFRIPVHAIGVGETIDDLQPFEAEGFSRAIAGLEDE